MIAFRKSIHRRAVLRGIGAALSLPLLDSMAPALRAAPAPVRRFGAVYVPNGVNMSTWTPDADGASFKFTPALKPLEPFRDRLLVLSGLNSNLPPKAKGPAGIHARACTRFLTDVPPKPEEGADLQAGTSIDQLIAKQFGAVTQLASLELGLETTESVGACDPGFNCAYTGTISWRDPYTPLPMEINPRVVFERMFGDSANTDPAVRRARMQQERSILDSVMEKVARLERELGPADCGKLDQYLEAIRDVERRIQKTEQHASKELPVVNRPLGVPDSFDEHAGLMYDLFALAFQTDLTRVVTFMIGHEYSGRTHPEIGVMDAHHAISHHKGDPVNLAKLTKVDTHHVELFAKLLQNLQATSDGDGSLLDHSMILYGSGMSDGNAHDPKNLPILVSGGGAGLIRPGRHLRFAKDTPLANLHLTILSKMGVRMDKVGDSTGELPQFSDIG